MTREFLQPVQCSSSALDCQRLDPKISFLHWLEYDVTELVVAGGNRETVESQETERNCYSGSHIISLAGLYHYGRVPDTVFTRGKNLHWGFTPPLLLRIPPFSYSTKLFYIQLPSQPAMTIGIDNDQTSRHTHIFQPTCADQINPSAW